MITGRNPLFRAKSWHAGEHVGERAGEHVGEHTGECAGGQADEQVGEHAGGQAGERVGEHAGRAEKTEKGLIKKLTINIKKLLTNIFTRAIVTSQDV